MICKDSSFFRLDVVAKIPLMLFVSALCCSYGSTKCGLRQLQSSLLKECKKSKVGVHTASPGMVLTDLLLRYVG